MKVVLRKLPVFLLLLFFISFNSYSQVEFVSEQNGTITIRTEGTNKKIEDAISDAEKYVFYTIFYQGIPGSTLKNGLIDKSENEVEESNKEYFKSFYENRYKSFIISVNQNGNIIKGKHRQKSIFFDITVNSDALRRDLENNQVIRKLGY